VGRDFFIAIRYYAHNLFWISESPSRSTLHFDVLRRETGPILAE
jgi:hypothetical protein